MSDRQVLLDADGSLPTMLIEVADGDTTIQTVQRDVLPLWGLGGGVVECLVDQVERIDEPDGRGSSIPVLVELPTPPVAWPPPSGLRWSSPAGPCPPVESGLAELLAARWEELAEGRAPPTLRSAWARPGWFERAGEWIRGTLADRGVRGDIEIEQIRHWGISAVMRVSADGRNYWFKATFPVFRHEPTVSAYLHREHPGWVADVLDVDVEEGWMLLADLEGDVSADDDEGGDLDQPTRQADAVSRLVEIQKSWAPRTSRLEAIGVVRRDLTDLPHAVDEILSDPQLQSWLHVPPTRALAVVDWLTGAVADIQALGFPATLVHGDFHPGNVAWTPRGPAIFDWSDASISHPLVDLITWEESDDGTPVSSDSTWELFRRCWGDGLPDELFTSLRPTFAAVAGAFHTVMYARLMRGLEGCRRIEAANGLTGFFAQLDRAVP